MGYIETLRTRPDMVSPGVSACQGCGGELVLRRVLQLAGPDTIVCVPPGCMAGSGAIGWSHDTGMKVPVHIPLLDNTASFLSGRATVPRRTAASRASPAQPSAARRCSMSATTTRAT